MRYAWIGVTGLLLCISPAAAPQVPISCVKYFSWKPSSSEVQVEKVRGGVETPPANLTLTTYYTHWFSEAEPDYMKPGPWKTVITVGDESGPLLRVTALRHANGGVQAEWVNEKLLFIRIWAGRLESEELVLDVAAARFIYSERAAFETSPPCGE